MMERREFSRWEYAGAHLAALVLFVALFGAPIALLILWGASR